MSESFSRIPDGPVQLFPTCLVDHFFPAVGAAAVVVLERAGFRVEVPQGLTCCGQPAFNSGAHRGARLVARHTIDRLAATHGPVVIPSGSCTHMILQMAEGLFRDDLPARERAIGVADRCHELSSFLVAAAVRWPALSHPPIRVAWHPACHQARGLGVREEPIALLDRIEGIERVPLERDDECCGFGGTFSVTQPEISGAILARKLDAIEASGAEAVVSADMGCLMHIAGGLRRRGSPIVCLHLAQVLRRALE